MEALLQYAWKHKMFPLKPLVTTDGLAVEVIDTGLQNTDAGPDFFNAKVKLGGTVWVGNVEIHDKSSLWTAHGHDRDAAYDNVVLHVVGEADADAVTSPAAVCPRCRWTCRVASATIMPHCCVKTVIRRAAPSCPGSTALRCMAG